MDIPIGSRPHSAAIHLRRTASARWPTTTRSPGSRAKSSASSGPTVRRRGDARGREPDHRKDLPPRQVRAGLSADALHRLQRPSVHAPSPASAATTRASRFRQRQTARGREQLPKSLSSDVSQSHEYHGVASIVIGQVVGLGRILDEPLSLVEIGPDNQSIGFRGGMGGEACHENTGNLQHGRAVVPRRRFDVRQRQADSLDDLKGVGCSTCHRGEDYST